MTNEFKQALSEMQPVIEMSVKELKDKIVEAIIDEQVAVHGDFSRSFVSADGAVKAIASLCEGGKAIRVKE